MTSDKKMIRINRRNDSILIFRGIQVNRTKGHPRTRRCFALARGGAYAFSGGRGARAGFGPSSFARMARSWPIRGDIG
jgi:hypothetical protein